jgi:HK97 family phage prohead protease
MNIERRTALEVRVAGGSAHSPRRLVGYASVFDKESEDLGGFTEFVRPGAFRASLMDGKADPLALVHHLPHLVLGRRSAGTLRLEEDSKGLAFEIDLPDTSTARDLAVSVERGDIRGASFAFTVRDNGDKWETRDNKVTRELLDVELHEITVTPTPAYPDTEVARRTLDTIIRPRKRLAIAKRWFETC